MYTACGELLPTGDGNAPYDHSSFARFFQAARDNDREYVVA